jgi:hypothetical protein
LTRPRHAPAASCAEAGWGFARAARHPGAQGSVVRRRALSSRASALVRVQLPAAPKRLGMIQRLNRRSRDLTEAALRRRGWGLHSLPRARAVRAASSAPRVRGSMAMWAPRTLIPCSGGICSAVAPGGHRRVRVRRLPVHLVFAAPNWRPAGWSASAASPSRICKVGDAADVDATEVRRRGTPGHPAGRPAPRPWRRP